MQKQFESKVFLESEIVNDWKKNVGKSWSDSDYEITKNDDQKIKITWSVKVFAMKIHESLHFGLHVGSSSISSTN